MQIWQREGEKGRTNIASLISVTKDLNKIQFRARGLRSLAASTQAPEVYSYSGASTRTSNSLLPIHPLPSSLLSFPILDPKARLFLHSRTPCGSSQSIISRCQPANEALQLQASTIWLSPPAASGTRAPSELQSNSNQLPSWTRPYQPIHPTWWCGAVRCGFPASAASLHSFRPRKPIVRWLQETYDVGVASPGGPWRQHS